MTAWLLRRCLTALGKWADVSIVKLLMIIAVIVAVVRTPQRFLRYLPLLLALGAASRFLRPREKSRPPRNFN